MRTKWWGWGPEGKEYGLKKNKNLLSYLQEALDLDLKEHPRISFNDITLPKITLSRTEVDQLKSITTAHLNKYDRLTHCMGKGYKDLIRIRKGDIKYAPEVVVYPAKEEEVEETILFAFAKLLRIIPFGGGTSVVGGVEPNCEGTISLDMRLLNKIISIDKVSQTARVQAGILGPDLEEKLNKEGYTLGHFPQSFEHSTLGGWIATRAAGQSSTKYGKIEDMVESVTMHYPIKGRITTKTTPASASGPDIKQLIIGSEGIFGVITEATIKIHPLPETKHYCGFILKNFEEGMGCLRMILQSEIKPAVARLSDAEETRAMMKLSQEKNFLESLVKKAFKFYLKQKNYEEPCMLILGFEGPKEKVKFDFKNSKKIVKGTYLGASPGKQWLQNRFELPYLRDDLIELGVLVDTLESATNWSNLNNLYSKTKESIEQAIKDFGVKGFVQTHISHVYEEGASLYYTFVAKAVEGKEVEQWTAIKKAATDAIISNGGTLSHHHGIGYDHVAWIEQEHGKKGVGAIKKLKECFDPYDMLNPGKVIPK